MKYEKLFESKFNEKFGDWSKCEEDWIEVTDEEVKRDFEIAYKISCEANDERPWLILENAQKYFNNGKIISVPFKYYRAKNDVPKCGICGCSIIDTPKAPAISRRDNKTAICSDCAMNEAMGDFFNFRK